MDTNKIQEDGHTRICHRPLVGEDERREICAYYLQFRLAASFVYKQKALQVLNLQGFCASRWA